MDAESPDLVAQLGPEGRNLYALMTNDDPDRVEDLLAALPGARRARGVTVRR